MTKKPCKHERDVVERARVEEAREILEVAQQFEGNFVFCPCCGFVLYRKKKGEK